MRELTRFGISLEKELLKKFDRHIHDKNYRNRSEALRDLIRKELVSQEWVEGKEVAGTITVVYDHHKRELISRLTDIQHDFSGLIIASQHVHLSHDNCLETIVVKGGPSEINKLADRLKSQKGVKYGTLSIATTAHDL